MTNKIDAIKTPPMKFKLILLPCSYLPYRSDILHPLSKKISGAIKKTKTTKTKTKNFRI